MEKEIKKASPQSYQTLKTSAATRTGPAASQNERQQSNTVSEHQPEKCNKNKNKKVPRMVFKVRKKIKIRKSLSIQNTHPELIIKND